MKSHSLVQRPLGRQLGNRCREWREDEIRSGCGNDVMSDRHRDLGTPDAVASRWLTLIGGDVAVGEMVTMEKGRRVNVLKRFFLVGARAPLLPIH